MATLVFFFGGRGPLLWGGRWFLPGLAEQGVFLLQAGVLSGIWVRPGRRPSRSLRVGSGRRRSRKQLSPPGGPPRACRQEGTGEWRSLAGRIGPGHRTCGAKHTARHEGPQRSLGVEPLLLHRTRARDPRWALPSGPGTHPHISRAWGWGIVTQNALWAGSAPSRQEGPGTRKSSPLLLLSLLEGVSRIFGVRWPRTLHPAALL